MSSKWLVTYWAKLVLAGIVVLAAFLDLWNLWIQSFSVPYYAAAARSMLANPGIAFFNSFDSVGFVTVDKPPLGIWAQAASAAVFGFNSWSVVLPQALAGIGSVILIYFIVERPFGKPAGLIAAFALATTPIFVSTARDGTMDMQMIFVILLALWVALKATREQSLWLLLLSFALVGIGFNIKMIQAYVVLPGLIVIYLFGVNLPTRQKMVHLILALFVLAAISLSWALAVDAIPADQRPYIGTSGDNSVIGLILGHNGQEAFLLESTADTYGGPGLFRLFTHALSLQLSWLLPLALIGLLTWWRRPEALSLAGLRKLGVFSEKGLTLIALSLWLLPGLLYFSFTQGNWSTYYLATIAPPLAGLVGIGAVSMYQEYLSGRSTGWILVAAVLVTGLMQARILSTFVTYDPLGYGTLFVLELAGSMVCAALLVWVRVKNLQDTRWLSFPVACVAVGALFLAPAAWSCIPFETGSSAENAGGYNATLLASPLAGFLLTHAGNTTFIAAVPTGSLAGSLTIDTGRPVMAFGGYMGTDQILSPGQLSGLIHNGTVQYLLVLSENRSSDYRGIGYGENDAIYSWAEGHCAAVPVQEWSESNGYFWRQYGLYDCAGAS